MNDASNGFSVIGTKECFSYANGFIGLDNTLMNENDKGDCIDLNELNNYIQSPSKF